MDEAFEIEGIEEAVVAIETEPTLYECDDCVYKTKMKSNLFRHLHTRHRQPNDEGKSEQTRHDIIIKLTYSHSNSKIKKKQMTDAKGFQNRTRCVCETLMPPSQSLT